MLTRNTIENKAIWIEIHEKNQLNNEIGIINSMVRFIDTCLLIESAIQRRRATRSSTS